MATLTLTKENLDEVITENEITLIDFWAPWCGPCRNFSEIYEQVAQKHPDIAFGKVNIEDEETLREDFGIKSIPHLMVFRQNIVTASEVGLLTGSQLEALIEDAKQVNVEEMRQAIADSQASKD